MLLHIKNTNVYASIVEVSSKGGRLYAQKVFYKRANNLEEAVKWYSKLVADAKAGKWNIYNSDSIENFSTFVEKHFRSYWCSTAGSDTLFVGWSIGSDFERRNFHYEPTTRNFQPDGPDLKDGCDNKTCSPDLLITGGWDPHIECGTEGGECRVSWNCGTRRDPEDCEFVLKYDHKPWVFYEHDSPGTVSSVTYYVWNFPKNIEVIAE